MFFFFNNLKNWFLLFIVYFLFFITIINFDSVLATEPLSAVDLLRNNLIYPGKSVYVSLYIFDFDTLISMDKSNFYSFTDNTSPPFDFFYSKVVLPSGDIRWCVIFFNEGDTTIFEFSKIVSTSFDDFFSAKLQYYQDGFADLDWKKSFDDNTIISFNRTVKV